MDDQKPTTETQNPQGTTGEPTPEPKADNLQDIESANNKSTEQNTEPPKKDRSIQNANLKPWKEGDPSPNPKGRPKGILNFSTRLNMAIDRLAHEYAAQHNKKYKDQIAAGVIKAIDEEDVDIMGDIFAKYVNAARNGDLKTAKDLLDRSYGRAIQKVEVGGIEGNPLAEAKIKAAQAEAEAWERSWTQPATDEPEITEEEQSRQDDIQEDSTSMEEKLEALSQPA